MLLPRVHLPLASLDISASDAGFPRTRFVESRIKILDLEHRLGNTPTVVIAKSESKGTLFALERHDSGRYVMCKLGPWVDVGELARNASAVARDRLPQRQQRPESRPDPGRVASLLTADQRKKRAAIEAIQCHIRKKSKALPSPDNGGSDDRSDGPSLGSEPQDPRQLPSPDVRIDEHNAAGPEPDTQVLPAVEPTSLEPAADARQFAEKIFENIRSQYFETLYRSMGSLAYFAKGPLSRARSEFHLDLESNLDMADLIIFLQSLILTTVQIDKKYRETVPKLIDQARNMAEASDEGMRKKRKLKKMRLGKDALYPHEDECIRKWWDSNKPAPAEEDQSLSASQVNTPVAILRTRETQLQMILIFEILALEMLTNAENRDSSSLPTLPGAESGDQNPSTAVPHRRRNKHNLPVLIDVHADRLTIWQSIASDVQNLVGESQNTLVSQDSQVQQQPSSEPLKDFCVDVIVPFLVSFSARLPQLCDAISRKLGGPAIISPVQSKSLKRPSSRREQKPGTAAKRPSLDAKRTLQRALSTEQMQRRSVSRGPSNALALLRSASTTALVGVKREGSEPVSLKDLPRRTLSAGRRGPILSRSSSASRVEDSKASKQALVEAELKDAISALRKPNREVVGKAMAEADERRATASLSAKKARRLPRSTLAPAVQVKATPTNNRFRDVFGATTAAEYGALLSSEDLVPPSSIGNLIPSTGHRHGHRDALAPIASPSGVPFGETPSRSFSQPAFVKTAAQDQLAMLPSTPSIQRNTAAVGPIARQANHGPAMEEPWPATEGARREIAATPVRNSSSRMDPLSSPVPFLDAGKATEMSIYEKLGWDDDFDDI
ncbi:DNA replication regulator Sld3 [Moelleriella libera RCEF 2490]|uniref:DNA replication regulator Sld3 n=1 Tax=Moelleriella libera RCEF 2490 TaxID=1081109 RepID=A0A166UQC5_9HYPO|nr:DNA replication regulator Sld3 [Moelleriella libera RCEF 2490]